MSAVVALGLILGTPLVLSVLSRVKPIYLFVAIMTGYVLATFLGDTADLTFQAAIHVSHNDVVVHVFLLVFPVILTLLFMRKTLSTAALPFQFILLVGNSLLLGALLVPLLSPGTQGALYSTHAGNVFRQAHDDIIAGVSVLQCLAMWLNRQRHHDEHGHHGKKHHR